MRLLNKKKILSGLMLLVSLAAQSQGNKNALRLFLVGNSFSINASRYLPELSKEAGYELTLGRAELGGCSLQRHWDSVAVNLLDSSRGKAYDGKSLKQLLSGGKWDVITIQQYSLLSGDVATYSPYARSLFEFIRKLQPSANIVFHQTWAYRSDAKNFGRVKGKTSAKTQQEMWEKSRQAYHTMADSLGIGIIPVGDAFWQVANSKDWAFQKDTSFHINRAVYPALPAEANSLNIGYAWDKDQKLKFDPNHANDAGCYLAGLLWYSFLFNKNPAELTFKPASVPDEFAVYMKKVAWQTLKKQGRDNRDWYITYLGKS